MSAKVICVTNQKGGVGKTTTAVNLSYYLAKDKKKTLLVDFDPQGNATSGLGIEKTDKDTLGATMTEVILGAAIGYEAIPKFFLDDLELHDVILHMADDLYRGEITEM